MTPSLQSPDLWEKLLNKHLRGYGGLTSNDTVIAQSTQLLTELDKLLADYRDRAEALLDAIAWILVQTYLWAVADAPLIMFGTNQRSLEGKRRACLQFVDSRLGLLSAATHLAARYTAEVRRRIDDVFAKLTEVAKTSIASLNWADSEAKAEAIRKLDVMKRDVFPTQDFFDAKGLPLLYAAFALRDNYSFIERFLHASERLQGFVASAAYEDVYRRRLAEPSPVLTSYVYYTNAVHVSLDALESPAFTVDGTLAMNFGGVGSYVAREMCRSFDPIGSALDSTGNNRLWWGPEVSSEYQQRRSCIVDVTPRWAMSIAPSGRDSKDATGLSENYHSERMRSAATMTWLFPHVPAIEITFAAYRQASHDNQTTNMLRLPYLETSTEDQIFFLTYCYMLCAPKESADEAANACNLPLTHFAPFAEAFNCPVGSPMNPADKCTFFDLGARRGRMPTDP